MCNMRRKSHEHHMTFMAFVYSLQRTKNGTLFYLIFAFLDEIIKMYPVNRTVWFLKSHVNPFLRTHYIFN